VKTLRERRGSYTTSRGITHSSCKELFVRMLLERPDPHHDRYISRSCALSTVIRVPPLRWLQITNLTRRFLAKRWASQTRATTAGRASMGGMKTGEFRGLKELEAENARLKQLVQTRRSLPHDGGASPP